VSLVCGLAAILILVWVRHVRPTALPNPSAWLANPSSYLTDNLSRVATFFVAYGILSVTIAALVAALMGLGQTARINPNTTGWFEVFRHRLPDDTFPMARVLLEDGTEYVGEVTYYDVAKATADREIVLGPPLWRKTKEGRSLEPLPAQDGWRRVVVPGARIEAVWVRYPVEELRVEPPGPLVLDAPAST